MVFLRFSEIFLGLITFVPHDIIGVIDGLPQPLNFGLATGGPGPKMDEFELPGPRSRSALAAEFLGI